MSRNRKRSLCFIAIVFFLGAGDAARALPGEHPSDSCPKLRTTDCLDPVSSPSNATPGNAINPACVERGHEKNHDVTIFGDSLSDFIVFYGRRNPNYFDDQNRLSIDVSDCVSNPQNCVSTIVRDNVLGEVGAYKNPTPDGNFWREAHAPSPKHTRDAPAPSARPTIRCCLGLGPSARSPSGPAIHPPPSGLESR